MLTRDASDGKGRSVCGGRAQNERPVSKEEIQLAINRVQEMTFVGITEEWNLSICLFHSIYGSTCSGHDFINTRRNPHEHHVDSDFRDEIDRPLYKAATQ